MPVNGEPFYLNDWYVQPDHLKVIRPGGESITLEPRMMDVLMCLARRPGDVVPRETIMEEVWKDCVVVDDTLTRCVSQLRKILGDVSDAPAYIETIRSKGYRLMVPPTKEPLVKGNRNVLTQKGPHPTPLITVSLVILVFVLGWKLGLNSRDYRESLHSQGGLPPIFIEDDSTVHVLSLPAGENVFYFSKGDTASKWITEDGGTLHLDR